MKLSAIFAPMALLLVTSCAPTRPDSLVCYFDYTNITDSTGVHFTQSYAVSFDYEALGTILVDDMSGFEKKEDDEPKNKKLFLGGLYNINNYNFVRKSGQSVLKILAEEAKKRGGDYVLGLKLDSYYINYEHCGWIATGMVVKRK